MTHRATHKQSGSTTRQASNASLLAAIEAHSAAEVASFHTPGHKGIAPFAGAVGAWRLDVTELPGLDELAHPNAGLAQLEERAATTWQTQASYLSLNGASGALQAAVLACASGKRKALLPANAHRSTINALVLAGLEPIWCQIQWHNDWHIGGSIDAAAFENLLTQHEGELALAMVVSPTYAGEISQVAPLAQLCKQHKVPLIVDEAHGTHFLPGAVTPPSALQQGADLVAHSLHKTVGALTQTGLLHVGKDSQVPPHSVHAAMNILRSSSPSYLLMASIEQALTDLTDSTLQKLLDARQSLERQLSAIKGITVFQPADCSIDPLHVLVKVAGLHPAQLYDECCQWGVFPEAVLGDGVLFLLGTGTRPYEIETLAEALEQVSAEAAGTNGAATLSAAAEIGYTTFEQILPPRQAFFSPCESVSPQGAIGRIAAECIAPCPPGTAVVVPGARISAEAVSFCNQTQIRVVIESGLRRT